jgi:catechol 2,3-dioxygenase-like lactoylglutathione lyase family enzyme
MAIFHPHILSSTGRRGPCSPWVGIGHDSMSTRTRSNTTVVAHVTHRNRKVVFSNTFQHQNKTQLIENKTPVFQGMHHVGLLCENLEKSLEFYMGILDLEINPDRPDDKLPYRGAWLWIGPEMIHLMELPNPDPMQGRPEHGGRDRHVCVGVKELGPLEERLKDAGVEYTKSMSGRAAIFFRDPDMNCLECVEFVESWRGV